MSSHKRPENQPRFPEGEPHLYDETTGEEVMVAYGSGLEVMGAGRNEYELRALGLVGVFFRPAPLEGILPVVEDNTHIAKDKLHVVEEPEELKDQ